MASRGVQNDFRSCSEETASQACERSARTRVGQSSGLHQGIRRIVVSGGGEAVRVRAALPSFAVFLAAMALVGWAVMGGAARARLRLIANRRFQAGREMSCLRL